jgi:hypothetical protein
MNYPKRAIPSGVSILIETAIIVGLSLNQAAAYVAYFIWKVDFSYYLVMVIFFTLVSSLYIRNLSKGLIYSLASIVIGAVIGLGIVLIPPYVHMSYGMIDATISSYAFSISKALVFNLMIDPFSSILGALLSGGV